MNDYELVIKRCKELEGLLTDGFGATGRGLHEKVSSVEGRLSQPLVKRLRFIATVRNKLVHDDDFQGLDDPAGYAEACDKAEEELRSMMKPTARRGVGSNWLWKLAKLLLEALTTFLKKR